MPQQPDAPGSYHALSQFALDVVLLERSHYCAEESYELVLHICRYDDIVNVEPDALPEVDPEDLGSGSAARDGWLQLLPST